MKTNFQPIDTLFKALVAEGFKLTEPTQDKEGAWAAAFPAMSASKGSLKRALKAAEWVKRQGKFPAVETYKSKDERGRLMPDIQKQTYYARAGSVMNGQQATVMVCPQDGKVVFATYAVKAEVEVVKKKDKRPPIVQAMDRFKDPIVAMIEPGTTHQEAVDMCVAALVLKLEHMPEEHRERVAKKAVKSWGPLGKPPLPVPMEERVVPPKPQVVKTSTLTEMLNSFGL